MQRGTIDLRLDAIHDSKLVVGLPFEFVKRSLLPFFSEQRIVNVRYEMEIWNQS
jgi:hypothetical protein